MLYSADPDCRYFLHSNGLKIEEVDFDDIIRFDMGMLVKLIEQHIQHVRDYPSRMHLIPLGKYLQLHVPMMNKLHHAIFKAQGYDFPLDEAIENISDYIIHFLRHRPDKSPPFVASVMVPHLVEFLINFYCGTPDNNLRPK